MAEVRTTAWMQEIEQRRERLPETQEQFFRRSRDIHSIPGDKKGPVEDRALEGRPRLERGTY